MKLLVSGLVAAADKRHVRIEHSTSFTCLHIDVSPTRTAQTASVLHSAYVIEMYLKASGIKIYIPLSRSLATLPSIQPSQHLNPHNTRPAQHTVFSGLTPLGTTMRCNDTSNRCTGGIGTKNATLICSCAPIPGVIGTSNQSLPHACVPRLAPAARVYDSTGRLLARVC